MIWESLNVNTPYFDFPAPLGERDDLDRNLVADPWRCDAVQSLGVCEHFLDMFLRVIWSDLAECRAEVAIECKIVEQLD